MMKEHKEQGIQDYEVPETLDTPESPLLNPEEHLVQQSAEIKKVTLNKMSKSFYKRRNSGSPCSSNNSTASESKNNN